MKKRYFKEIIFLAAAFLLVVLASCSFTRQSGSASFTVSQSVMKAAIQKSQSFINKNETDGFDSEYPATYKFEISIKGDYTDTKSLEYTEQEWLEFFESQHQNDSKKVSPLTIEFTDLPVNATVYAEASVSMTYSYTNSETNEPVTKSRIIFTGTSEKTVITANDNSLDINLKTKDEEYDYLIKFYLEDKNAADDAEYKGYTYDSTKDKSGHFVGWDNLYEILKDYQSDDYLKGYYYDTEKDSADFDENGVYVYKLFYNKIYNFVIKFYLEDENAAEDAEFEGYTYNKDMDIEGTFKNWDEFYEAADKYQKDDYVEGYAFNDKYEGTFDDNEVYIYKIFYDKMIHAVNYKIEYYLQKEAGSQEYELDESSTATGSFEQDNYDAFYAKTIKNAVEGYLINLEKSTFPTADEIDLTKTFEIKLYFDAYSTYSFEVYKWDDKTADYVKDENLASSASVNPNVEEPFNALLDKFKSIQEIVGKEGYIIDDEKSILPSITDSYTLTDDYSASGKKYEYKLYFNVALYIANGTSVVDGDGLTSSFTIVLTTNNKYFVSNGDDVVSRGSWQYSQDKSELELYESEYFVEKEAVKAEKPALAGTLPVWNLTAELKKQFKLAIKLGSKEETSIIFEEKADDIDESITLHYFYQKADGTYEEKGLEGGTALRVIHDPFISEEEIVSLVKAEIDNFLKSFETESYLVLNKEKATITRVTDNPENAYAFEAKVYFDRTTVLVSFVSDEETVSEIKVLYGASIDFTKVTLPEKEGYELSGWFVSCYNTEQDNEASKKGEAAADFKEFESADYTVYPFVKFIAKWQNATIVFKVEMEKIKIDGTEYELETTTDDENVIFRAPEGFDSYTWYIDNTKKEEKTCELSVPATDSELGGVYQVRCEIKKGTDTYYLEGTVRIISDGTSTLSNSSVEVELAHVTDSVGAAALKTEYDAENEQYRFTVAQELMTADGTKLTPESYLWLVDAMEPDENAHASSFDFDIATPGVYNVTCTVKAKELDYTFILSAKVIVRDPTVPRA